jgi:hypothetical protein
MRKDVLIGIIALALVIAGISVWNFINTGTAKWECFAQTCSEYATGDQWVKQNCQLDSNNKMICDFYLYTQTDLQKQRFVIPLDSLNVSQMVSCKTYTCSSYVLVKQLNSGGNKQ